MNKEAVIKFRKEGRVAVLAFDVQVAAAQTALHIESRFADICSEITADPQMQVIVITGANDNTLRLKAPDSFAEPENFGVSVPSIVDSAASLQVPVLIGLHGFITGQALELALACDIRIATLESQFALPQVSMGFIPFEGGTQRLPRIVGASKALEMILTGETIDAETGYRIGLVNRIVTADKLSSEIISMAQQMSASSAISLRYAKEAITKGMDLPLEQGLRLEADLYFLLHTTKDRQEGIRAFREKRKPKFKGI